MLFNKSGGKTLTEFVSYLNEAFLAGDFSVLINVQPGILPEGYWRFASLPQDVVVRFPDRLGPENCHVYIAEVIKSSSERAKILVNVIKLILRRHFPEFGGGGAEGYGRRGHELYQPYRAGAGGVSYVGSESFSAFPRDTSHQIRRIKS